MKKISSRYRKGVKVESKARFRICYACGKKKRKANIFSYACGHYICNNNTLNSCGWHITDPAKNFITDEMETIVLRDRRRCAICRTSENGGGLKPKVISPLC